MREASAEAQASALKSFDELPDAAFVRVPVVAALNGVGVTTVWRWARDGRLPKPLKIGPAATGWNVGALRQNLAARQQAGGVQA